MYLKALELEGFKSFSEKTIIEFTNGITSIVGPNGSGKSNILDAILWVLGEQSYKNIRASMSNDVIFSGGKNKRAAQSAYVSLIINNEDRYLDVESNEVKITRRIYKNGEGEYLINNKKVRLKDIHNLFMDTGIGKQAYSIIGQGRVERIISSNPKEVREILEEAAGTKRAKIEKEEALKKLSNVNQELEKIVYVEKELNIRVNKLKVESEKASLHNELVNQIKINSYMINEYNIEKLSNYQNELEEKKEKVERDIKNIEKSLEDENIKLTFLLEDRKNKNQDLSKLKEKTLIFQSYIDNEREKLNDLEKNKSNFEVQLTEKIKLKDKLLNDKLNLEEKISKLSKEKKELEIKLQKKVELKDSLSEKISHLNDLRLNLEEKINVKDSMLKETEVSNYRLNMENEELERKIKLSNNNIKTLDKEKNEFKLEYEKFELNLKDLEMKHSKNEDKLNKINEENNKIYEKISNLENFKKNIIKEKSKKIYELEQLNSRYISIKKTLDENVYSNKGVQYIMKNFKDDDNIVGVVSNLIDIPEKYLIAISTLISFNLNDIVIKSFKDVSKYINKLKENQISTASFLPLDNIKTSKILKEKPLNDGIIDFARNLVSIKDSSLNKVLESILSNALVVKNINVANLIIKSGYIDRIVTLDGDIVSSKGRITGGFKASKIDLSLKKKDELLKLKENIGNIEKFLLEHEKEYEKINNEIENLNTFIEKNLSNNEFKLQFNELANKIEIMKNNLITTKRKLQTIDYEISDTNNHIVDNKNRLYENNLKIKENKKLLEEIFDERETLEFEIAKLENVEKYEKKLNEVLIDFAVLNEKSTNNNNNLDDLNLNYKNVIKDLDDIYKFEYNKEELFSNFNIDIKEVSQKLDALINERKEDVSILNNLEKEIKNVEKMESESISNINTLEKEILKNTNIIENISENIGRNSKELEILNEKILQIFEEKEKILNSNIYRKLEQEDIKEIQKEINRLENKKNNIGSINFSSIEEYEKENERYQILLKQKIDLEKSLNSIKELIFNIEKEMVDKFSYALKEIRANFKYMCFEIFYGAKGDLKLTDEKNILTSGIELSVKYKNKPEQTLMLLSGGEKSMLAVSFIMAIFMFKPSPFTFFDEIEAALDEANTRKIIELLRRFIDKSQFILITHNKETMKGSDRLYGVTMNKEIGESRVVSVDI